MLELTMCSSPGGSSKSTVNKPRTGGMYADMSASARASFAKTANAADDRKTERLARQRLKLMNETLSSNSAHHKQQNQSKKWYTSVFSYFY